MKITAEQKRNLLNLAESMIKEHLGVESQGIGTTDPLFQQKSGVFVTLQKNKQLRGCIGSLSAHQSILEGVQGHAINAAFHDHRFSPVTREELKDIDIEISILTEPKVLEFADSKDLLEKLRPHVDGVTLYYGNQSATFLPQVWEQLPDPEKFLSHLALKAGLSGDGWREKGIRIDIYAVIKF